ncbi:MAG: Hsp20 family protein [Sphingomonas sp.]
MRTNFDFAPYRRSTVGFDRLFDLLESGMRGDAASAFPPFDIVREGEDNYRITLAVPGFRLDQIEVIAQQNQLTISGKRSDDDRHGDFLHRGIASSDFERRFQLADFIEVGQARFDDGLLSIELNRVVPEAMKPRKIDVASAGATHERIETQRDERAAA